MITSTLRSLSLTLLLIGSTTAATAQVQRNKEPSINLTLSTNLVTLQCRPGHRSRSGSCADAPTIKIHAETAGKYDPSSPLKFSTTGGRVVGTGERVVWDLSGVKPGNYSVTVTRENATSSTVWINVRYCPDCLGDIFCPTLNLRGPSGPVKPGSIAEFAADVSGSGTISYGWRVEGGRIVSAKNLNNIQVRVTNKYPGKLTAAVHIEGEDLREGNCLQDASAEAEILPDEETSDYQPDRLVLDKTAFKLPCPKGVNCGDKPSESFTVHVRSEIRDAHADLEYRYTVSGGHLITAGREVAWDVAGLEPGTYVITVTLYRHNRPVGITLSSRIRMESAICICDCECPTINALGPDKTKNGEIIAFSADVSGSFPVTYNWTVSNGEIVSGQGTSKIQVRVIRQGADKRVRSTVAFGGFDPVCVVCPSSAEAATYIID